jgi:hypothetical protein
MKKLYLASETITAMFVSDEKTKMEDAKEFLAEERKNVFKDAIVLREITSSQEIPKEWNEGALIWGIDDEITAAVWLHDRGPEYLEYLRLKAKFEEDA